LTDDSYPPRPSLDYIFDFQSPDFEKDSQILSDFLLHNVETLFPNIEKDNETQTKKNYENMFRLEKTSYTAGWSFSKLHLNEELVKKMYEANYNEFKRASSAWKDMWSIPKGMQYIGDPFVEGLVRWLTAKIKEKGGSKQAQIKIGKEMADMTQGMPGSGVATF
jgi:hypothetical protein